MSSSDLTDDHQPLSAASPPVANGDASAKQPISEHDRIINRLQQLKPWRMPIQITSQINTGDFLELGISGQYSDGKAQPDHRKRFHRLLNRLYPDGLQTKRLLDCGCGAGGFCFWARELKVELAFGFDVREHWIKQARFIRFNRTIGVKKRLRFEVLNLYDLPNEDLFPFDIVLFKGLFFNLPDPIAGLKIAADRCRDVLVFSTKCIWGQPDGSLTSLACQNHPLHGGTTELNWYPTGPRVCAEIIRSLGFEHIVLKQHKQATGAPDRGRIEIIASREPNRLPKHLGEELD